MICYENAQIAQGRTCLCLGGEGFVELFSSSLHDLSSCQKPTTDLLRDPRNISTIVTFPQLQEQINSITNPTMGPCTCSGPSSCQCGPGCKCTACGVSSPFSLGGTRSSVFRGINTSMLTMYWGPFRNKACNNSSSHNSDRHQIVNKTGEMRLKSLLFCYP